MGLQNHCILDMIALCRDWVYVYSCDLSVNANDGLSSAVSPVGPQMLVALEAEIPARLVISLLVGTVHLGYQNTETRSTQDGFRTLTVNGLIS